MSGNTLFGRIDWLSILLFFVLTLLGWVSIYSSTYVDAETSIFDFSQLYGKQLMFIGISLIVAISILFIEANFFERFGSIMYIGCLVLLVGLFVFGKTIAGATSWYSLGFFNLQPSELAKFATALALAKYLSDIQTDIKRPRHQLFALLIIFSPVLLIIPQPDPGSALVFVALIFVLFREGLPLFYLVLGLVLLVIFIATLKFGTIWVAIGLGLLMALFFMLKKASLRIPVFPMIIALILAIGFSFSVRLIFDNVFEQRHRDRFVLWLRLEKDPEKLEEIRKTIGYNTFQSEKAIESGGLKGKGFLEGTRTKGDFVPEQHTDYIFTTIGEEWGFLGTSIVVILFTLLLLRLVALAERQKTDFARMYGYGVISILLIHYFINIGMVIGLIPTIGIPLPFFSYGGSGLIGFTILLFVFLKIDASRLNVI